MAQMSGEVRKEKYSFNAFSLFSLSLVAFKKPQSSLLRMIAPIVTYLNSVRELPFIFTGSFECPKHDRPEAGNVLEASDLPSLLSCCNYPEHIPPVACRSIGDRAEPNQSRYVT